MAEGNRFFDVRMVPFITSASPMHVKNASLRAAIPVRMHMTERAWNEQGFLPRFWLKMPENGEGCGANQTKHKLYCELGHPQGP